MFAYIINLKHRYDRKESIINEMKKLPHIKYEFVEGVISNPSWLGCTLSHKKCIQLAKDNNLDNVLVLEDDAIFTDNCIEILEKSLEQLKGEYNMLFLGANLQNKADSISNNILKLNGAFAAHAYIVNSNFYDTILNLPNNVIDVSYNRLMAEYNLFMCNPIIAYQTPSYSDLEDGFRDYNQAIITNYKTYS